MSEEQPPLERRYRRLLACYPRAFRRENTEEILAVLLACAEDGRQRPGLAASADLIGGAVRMRLRIAGQPPQTVRAAVKLMYAGAVAELAALVTVIVTAGQVRSAVARSSPNPSVQHVVLQAVNVSLTIDYVSVPAGLVAWLLLTRALIRGRPRARAWLALSLGLMTVGLLVAIGQGSMIYAPADLAAGAVEWLIALAATVLLFTGTSSRYYHPGPRPVTPWRGTFGTW